MKKQLLTLTGPSAGGKTTLNKRLDGTGKFYSVVSHTTRQMRIGEVDGVDYHFVAPESFSHIMPDMVEVVNFHGNGYGAHPDELNKAWSLGLVPILVLTPEGLEMTRDWCLKNNVEMTAVYVGGESERLIQRYLCRFIRPNMPSGDELQVLLGIHASRVAAIITEIKEWPIHFNRIIRDRKLPNLVINRYDSDTCASYDGIIAGMVFSEPVCAETVRFEIVHSEVNDSLQALQRDIVVWASSTFKDRSVHTVIRKLVYSEIPELTLALGRHDKIDIENEIADVNILLLDLCSQMGIDYYGVTRSKLQINRGRQWENNEFGVSQHVEERQS